MGVFLTLFILFHGTMAWSFVELLGLDSCGWDRKNPTEAIQCFANHFDTDHNGEISVAEVEAAREKYGGWLLKAISYLVSWKLDVSTESALRECDPDHDGIFTEKDFRESYKTCLPTPIAFCLLKRACDRMDSMEPPVPLKARLENGQ